MSCGNLVQLTLKENSHSQGKLKQILIEVESYYKSLFNKFQILISKRKMSLATIGYRQVQKIVSSWTQKYQYHISLMDTKPQLVKFMVEFSLATPQKPIPVGTVRVYFTCKNINDELEITFRFEKDSLIHSIDQTIRHKQLQKWLDDALQKKLLVRKTVFYLGTSYEHTRVSDERQDKILQQKIVPQQEEFIYIHPQLLADQQRSIQIMQKPKNNIQLINRKLDAYWKEIDKENIRVITHPQLIILLKNIGINLSQTQFKEILQKVDKEQTGTVEYINFYEVGYELIESFQSKKIADSRLLESKDQQIFGSILALINDEAQSIEGKIYEKLKSKDELETGLTNIQEVKATLQWINSSAKQTNLEEPLSPIEMAELTKILTDFYGYKQIPYEKIHKHIIDLKIANFTKGRVSSNMNNLQVYLRDIFDKYDDKKFGKIQVTHMVEALKKSQKIKLTKAQIYVLENIVPKDSKNQINYIEISKLLAEIIKKFYICSKKRKQ